MSVNVPSGYKQTKVGVIPEDWDVVKLGDIAPSISYGLTVRPKYIEDGIPLISAREIKNGVIDYDNAPNISQDDFNNLSKKSKAQKGDIFLSKTGTIGRVAYVLLDDTIAITQNIAIIRVNGKKYSHQFLLQYLITNTFQISAIKKVNQSTIMDLQLQDIKKLLAPLPPLKEQQKIAQVLITWDDAISKQEALIKVKEELKKGLMQKLLSGEVRFDGFNGEWGEVRLRDIAKINPKNNNLPEAFIYIDLESVKNGILLKESMIYKNNAPSRAQRLLANNDILYQTVRPYQKNNFFFDLGGNYVASTGYAQIRALESSRYLYQYLHWDVFVSKVLLRCTGTSYPAINSTDLGKIKIKFPAKEEQEKIAEVLTLADKEIDLLKDELEALKEQKRGLMQRLLSGGVRVMI